MNEKRASLMTICLLVVLALSPALGFAQCTTTFSGEAVALKANGGGAARAGGYRTAAVKRWDPEHVGRERQRRRHSLAEHARKFHVWERNRQPVASDAPKSNLLNALVAATAVKANSSAGCSCG